jgi:hypothetical protein
MSSVTAGMSLVLNLRPRRRSFVFSNSLTRTVFPCFRLVAEVVAKPAWSFSLNDSLIVLTGG